MTKYNLSQLFQTWDFLGKELRMYYREDHSPCEQQARAWPRGVTEVPHLEKILWIFFNMPSKGEISLEGLKLCRLSMSYNHNFFMFYRFQLFLAIANQELEGCFVQGGGWEATEVSSLLNNTPCLPFSSQHHQLPALSTIKQGSQVVIHNSK